MKSLLFLSCSFGALAYETERNVLKLGQTDFDQARIQFPDLLVKFYAPWCGHCKTLAPTYLDAADELKNQGSSARLAEIDCTIHKSLCQKYQVKGYPTVQFFGKGAETPQKYTDPRSKQAFVKWINDRSPVTTQTKQEEKQVSKYEKEESLLKLSVDSFKDAKQDFDYLFVKFFAPWCGHCKTLAKTWVQFANTITDPKVAIAEVDCTVHQPVCQQNKIQGYPSLRLFVKGHQQPITYSKGRTIENFSAFLQQHKINSIPLDVKPTVEVSAQEL